MRRRIDSKTIIEDLHRERFFVPSRSWSPVGRSRHRPDQAKSHRAWLPTFVELMWGFNRNLALLMGKCSKFVEIKKKQFSPLHQI